MKERGIIKTESGEELPTVKDSSGGLEYTFTCEFVPTQAEDTIQGSRFFSKLAGIASGLPFRKKPVFRRWQWRMINTAFIGLLMGKTEG